MSEKKNELSISQKIDGIVLSVIGDRGLVGFEKAHRVSTAIVQLETILDAEYMKPIMYLQGTTLGFKTDKDLVKSPQGGYVKGPGYPIEVVKRCMIEAVLKGYQPTNNEFNIIGGNMYPTKNGLERQANEYPGLKYSIILRITAFDKTKGSAEVDAHIKWSINGEDRSEVVPIPLKIDAYTSVDAVQGKAKRKALAWMLSNVTGETVVDGDVEDIGFKDVTPKVEPIKTIKSLPVCGEDELLDCIESIKAGEHTVETLSSILSFTPEQLVALNNVSQN